MKIEGARAIEALDFARGGGLLPVVAQHARTGEVLMLGYADREALERSLPGGLLTFHSRSRDMLWTKGETSGNTLRVVSLHADCDRDAVLALVEPAGPTCHTGERSCFGAAPTLPALAGTLAARRAVPDGESYTGRLLNDRNLRLKKLGEEAVELAVACADGDSGRVREEAADLLYHLLTACLAEGVELDDILGVLEARRAGGG
ncbi:MAG TPA: bifunctional phosphoribosyl-AMP cyclohydrolase/phosphoribosyl-ATP diphosphatase HisIE [Longimicrobiaceae bacterium]|nr:bifunctional phosphoribosyl-AMP cyclohydrolase/phosphoribosyl-ATP diphosphatase HisIE [Longimicrobiaceae bacterium]